MKHIPRLFIQGRLIVGQELDLDKFQSHHIMSVLRLTKGQHVYAFNSDEGEYLCELVELHKKHCRIRPKEKSKEPEITPEIRLFFAPVKSHRTDMILEKGTELGVTHFHPCIFEYSMIRNFRSDKARLLCIQAAQQSGRLDIPEVYEQEKIMQAVKWMHGMQTLFCDVGADINAWKGLSLNKDKPLALIVGPEGGISNIEREQFLKIPQVYPISLGETILRAETAVISALAILRSL